MPSPFLVACTYCTEVITRRRIMSAYFCNFTCKAEWQKRNNKPVTEEWLRDAYLVKMMDCTQIAKIVNRDPKSVWNWLQAFGIPCRPRGSNHAQLPKDGSSFRGKNHTEEYKQAQRDRRLADGHVPYLKNGQHWLKEEGAQSPAWKGGITPERQAFYATEEWKECVKQVWRRDDALCRVCKLDHRFIERGNPRYDIHHIDSFMIKERRAVLDNLVLLCQPCHKWIHSLKNTERRYLGAGH